MIFVPETYTIRLGKQKKTLRIRKEPFGCTIFDRKAAYECNRSFFFVLSEIIAERRSSAVMTLSREYEIPEEDAVEGYDAFVQFFLRKGWIRSEDDLDKVEIAGHTVLSPLELDTVYNMAPNSIDYHITLRCNLACPHCSFYERIRCDDHGPELSVEEWYRILEQLDENGVMQILITGGEPLLRDDLIDILSFVIDKTNLFVVVNTNGILWTGGKVREFTRITGDRGTMIISLDGNTPQTYGTTRKLKDSTSADIYFENVVETAHLAENNGTTFSFIFVLSKATYAHSLETIQWALEEFPHALNLSVLRFDVTEDTKRGLELSYKEWKQWLYAAVPLREKYKNRFLLGVACGGELHLPLKGDERALSAWGSSIVTPLTSEMYRLRRNVGCHAAVTDLSVAPDGTVYGCGLYTGIAEWYLGDLKSDSFYDIWHHGELIKKFRYLDMSQIDAVCGTCPVRELCGGGCRGRAFTATGNFYGPDPYCPYAWGKAHD